MQIRSKKSGFCCKLKGKFGKKRQNLPHFAFRDPVASIPVFRDAKNGRYPGISGSRYIPLDTLEVMDGRRATNEMERSFFKCSAIKTESYFQS